MLPVSQRGPSPSPKAPPAPKRTPPPGPTFDPGAVSSARDELAQLVAERHQPVIDYTQLREPQPMFVSGVQVQGPKPGEAPEDRVVAAQQFLDEALREQREQAIGVNQEGKGLHKPISKQVDRMTPEEYEALPPLQRAAVDFNGMLVQAVRKDRKNQDEYTPTPQQREVYDMSVEKMFGDDGGSTMYAPETLGLLRQINFDDQNADLDDFLGLKAAIKTDDLANLQRSATPPAVTGGVATDSQMSDVDFDKVALQRNLAESTQSMQNALVRGNQLLQSLGAMARVERSNDVARNLGGLPNQVQPAIGYGNDEVSGYFQRAFDLLASKKGDRDAIFSAMNQDLSGEEFQAFLQYANQRADQAQQYGLELGESDGVKYRSPEEFRNLLTPGKEGDR